MSPESVLHEIRLTCNPLSGGIIVTVNVKTGSAKVSVSVKLSTTSLSVSPVSKRHTRGVTE